MLDYVYKWKGAESRKRLRLVVNTKWFCLFKSVSQVLLWGINARGRHAAD